MLSKTGLIGVDSRCVPTSSESPLKESFFMYANYTTNHHLNSPLHRAPNMIFFKRAQQSSKSSSASECLISFTELCAKIPSRWIIRSLTEEEAYLRSWTPSKQANGEGLLASALYEHVHMRIWSIKMAYLKTFWKELLIRSSVISTTS